MIGKRIALMVGATLFFLLLLETVSYWAVRRYDARTAPVPELAWLEADAYSEADWVEPYLNDYFRIRLRWEPYLYWRRRPFESQWINVDEQGIRRTAPGRVAPAGEKTPRIFVFGGSTTWGEGARDDATIPSHLARTLAEAGIPAEVVNMGEGGYVSTQELIWLLRELQQGNVPDIALFYNGLNDMYSAAQSGEAGIPQNEWNRRAEFNVSFRRIQVLELALFGPRTGLYTARLLHRIRMGDGGGAPELPEGLAREVADVYLSNLRTIEALGEAYGFTPLVFWQPVLYNKPLRTPFEESLKETQPAHFEPFFDEAEGYMLQAFEEQDLPFVHYIGDLFAERADPFYIDFAHVSEVGNRMIAERIAEVVRTHSRLPASTQVP